MEAKVEWVDEDGQGHVTEFTKVNLAYAYFEAIKPLAMMADIYVRPVTEWKRQ